MSSCLFLIGGLIGGGQLLHLPLNRGDYGAAVCNPPDAAQQDRSQRHQIGDMSEHSVGQQGHWLRHHVAAIAKLLEGNARKKEYRSATHFAQSVDVIDVLGRVVANPLPRLGNQLVAIAELGGASGTDLSARRLLSL